METKDFGKRILLQIEIASNCADTHQRRQQLLAFARDAGRMIYEQSAKAATDGKLVTDNLYAFISSASGQSRQLQCIYPEVALMLDLFVEVAVVIRAEIIYRAEEREELELIRADPVKLGIMRVLQANICAPSAIPEQLLVLGIEVDDEQFKSAWRQLYLGYVVEFWSEKVKLFRLSLKGRCMLEKIEKLSENQKGP